MYIIKKTWLSVYIKLDEDDRATNYVLVMGWRSYPDDLTSAEMALASVLVVGGRDVASDRGCLNAPHCMRKHFFYLLANFNLLMIMPMYGSCSR